MSHTVIPIVLLHLRGPVASARVPTNHAAGPDNPSGEDSLAVDQAVADFDGIQWFASCGPRGVWGLFARVAIVDGATRKCHSTSLSVPTCSHPRNAPDNIARSAPGGMRRKS